MCVGGGGEAEMGRGRVAGEGEEGGGGGRRATRPPDVKHGPGDPVSRLPFPPGTEKIHA